MAQHVAPLNLSRPPLGNRAGVIPAPPGMAGLPTSGPQGQTGGQVQQNQNHVRSPDSQTLVYQPNTGSGAGQISPALDSPHTSPSFNATHDSDDLPNDGNGMEMGMGGVIGASGKRKQLQYDFRYDDSDTLLAELGEFFSYEENNQFEGFLVEFEEDFSGRGRAGVGEGEGEEEEEGEGEGGGEAKEGRRKEWTGTDVHGRRAYVEFQLEQLEHHDSEIRYGAAKRLMYLAMGNYAETSGPEHQLHWVIENAKLIRGTNGLPSVLFALQDAFSRIEALSLEIEQQHNQLSQSYSMAPGSGEPALSHNMAHHEASSAEIAATAANQEISIYLGIMYFVIEVFRSDEEFADELMALNPPLPVFLLSKIAGLRDKPFIDFPAKKLLLLLWKTLLACFGGLKEARKAVALQRDLAGLTPIKDDFTKVTPIGLAHFRKDVGMKYPTFEAHDDPNVGESLAEAVQPIPIRTGYHSSHEAGLPRAFVSTSPNQGSRFQPGANPRLPQPGTPAPSPPPSPPPKPKKQQYQTDQSRPFVFPFSRLSSAGDGRSTGRLVPYAIDEADKLYSKHMHVTLGLKQLYEVRADFIREESGLGSKGLIGFSASEDEWDEFDEDNDWSDYQLQDWKYMEKEEDCRQRGDKAGLEDAQQARLSLKRLYRVEVLYRSILPLTPSIVIVFLKHLLATVTAPTGPNESGSEMAANTPVTTEDIDVTRHREITSKAVSGILLLMLKWFKASHIMKFQYLSTQLIDSNALLLLLKILGFTDLPNLVQSKNDRPDLDMFNYCESHFSPDKDAPHRSLTPQPVQHSVKTNSSGDEIELLTDYSWRNFFYVINFVRIMHQLTKRRPARIHLLVTYKSGQILKRMLRVPHPMLQLQILKVLKSQVPLCGRKWRQNNMKTITAIYLNCKPELRDEWLAASDAEAEIEESQAAEATLRSLVRFFHQKRYSRYLVPSHSLDPMHKRSSSLAAGVGFEDLSISQGQPGRSSSLHRSDSDVFPPNKTLSRRSSGADISSSNSSSTYNVDSIMGSFLYEYEDLISEVLGTDESGELVGLMESSDSNTGSGGARGPAFGKNDPAWMRLNEIMRGRGLTDDMSEISDSESVVSIGELGSDARFGDDENGGDGDGDGSDDHAVDGDDFDGIGRGGDADSSSILTARRQQLQRRKSGNENTWEHISPELSSLPKSPGERPRRRSSAGGPGSSGSPLRPLMFAEARSPGSMGASLDSDWLEAVEDDEEPGPMPIEPDTEDEEARDHMAVDEVEAFFNV